MYKLPGYLIEECNLPVYHLTGGGPLYVPIDCYNILDNTYATQYYKFTRPFIIETLLPLLDTRHFRGQIQTNIQPIIDILLSPTIDYNALQQRVYSEACIYGAYLLAELFYPLFLRQEADHMPVGVALRHSYTSSAQTILTPNSPSFADTFIMKDFIYHKAPPRDAILAQLAACHERLGADLQHTPEHYWKAAQAHVKKGYRASIVDEYERQVQKSKIVSGVIVMPEAEQE